VLIPINHDAAWILEGAERLLAGGRFGIDVVDVNPPLAWWIAMVPAATARATGMPVGVVASVFAAALGAATLTISLWLVAREGAGPLAQRTLALAGAYLLVAAPGYDFGQREHLMVLLGLPYILLRGTERRPAPTVAFAIGLAGAAGFCLKPYFMLVPLGIEAWRWLRTCRIAGLIAPETVAVGLFGVGYATAIVLFAPAYLHGVVPAALAGYWAYDNSSAAVFKEAVMRALPAVLALAVAVTTGKRLKAMPSQAQALAIAGAMSLIGALIQMKGWRYHLLPMMIFLSFGACVACLAPAQASPGRLARALALAAALIACFPASALRTSGATAASVAELTDAFRRFAGPDGTVFGFVTSPRDVHPAVLAAGVKWAAPFCCVYLLPGLARASEALPAKRDAIEAAGRAQLEVALNVVRTGKPEVIVVDEAAAKLGFGERPFDYLHWLSRDPAWAAEFSKYRDAGLAGHFRLLVRN
jgi:hypothetical protein